jgi:hypothetical protein
MAGDFDKCPAPQNVRRLGACRISSDGNNVIVVVMNSRSRSTDGPSAVSCGDTSHGQTDSRSIDSSVDVGAFPTPDASPPSTLGDLRHETNEELGNSPQQDLLHSEAAQGDPQGSASEATLNAGGPTLPAPNSPPPSPPPCPREHPSEAPSEGSLSLSGGCFDDDAVTVAGVDSGGGQCGDAAEGEGGGKDRSDGDAASDEAKRSEGAAPPHPPRRCDEALFAHDGGDATRSEATPSSSGCAGKRPPLSIDANAKRSEQNDGASAALSPPPTPPLSAGARGGGFPDEAVLAMVARLRRDGDSIFSYTEAMIDLAVATLIVPPPSRA